MCCLHAPRVALCFFSPSRRLDPGGGVIRTFFVPLFCVPHNMFSPFSLLFGKSMPSREGLSDDLRTPPSSGNRLRLGWLSSRTKLKFPAKGVADLHPIYCTGGIRGHGPPLAPPYPTDSPTHTSPLRLEMSANKAFSLFTTENTAVVTRESLAKAAESLGQPLTEQDIDDIFKYVRVCRCCVGSNVDL
jgi:hypothetical protein